MIIKADRKEQKKNLNVSKLLLLFFIKSEPHHRDEGSEALQPSMNLIFWFLKVIFRFSNLRQLMINPLHPHISMHILYTVHYTYPMVLTRRI